MTGLAVRDTGTGFTPFGHAVILVLAQIGGLGLMTFASFFSLYLGQGLGIKQGLVLRDALNLESLHKARPLLIFMLKATFAIELAGAVAIYVLLTPYWKPELTVNSAELTGGRQRHFERFRQTFSGKVML